LTEDFRGAKRTRGERGRRPRKKRCLGKGLRKKIGLPRFPSPEKKEVRTERSSLPISLNKERRRKIQEEGSAVGFSRKKRGCPPVLQKERT